MKCDSSKKWLCIWLLAFSLLLCVSPLAHGQDMATSTPPDSELSPQSMPSTPMQSPDTTHGWQSFDDLWTMLKGELTASDQDSARLSELLQGLQTEADGLRRSLTESTALLQSSASDLAAERSAYREALVERDKWRMLAYIGGGVSASLALSLAASLIF